jgi:hypothetical protein
MPSNVKLFERLMCFSLGIGLLIMLLSGPRIAALPGVNEVGGLATVIEWGLGTLGVMALFVWLIARRRQNWARWIFAIVFALGLVPYFWQWTEMIQTSLAVCILSISQVLMQCVALYFVFSGNAREWFKGKAA